MTRMQIAKEQASSVVVFDRLDRDNKKKLRKQTSGGAVGRISDFSTGARPVAARAKILGGTDFSPGGARHQTLNISNGRLFVYF